MSSSEGWRAVVRTPAPLRWLLRVVTVGYLFMLVAWPVSLVVRNTFEGGLANLQTALSDPEVVHALQMTGVVAGVAVVVNLLFGVGISLLLVRYEFPGKRVLSTLVDVPLSGWLGRPLDAAGLQVIFATPGMVMATVFVALPLVIREVVPVLEEVGDEQEQAARSLGANGAQTFWRVTLPGIKWAVVYGVVLSLARSLGEFGAVKIVSGNVVEKTQTTTLVVEQTYQNFEQGTAYAAAFLLAFASVLCIVIVSILRPKDPA